MMLRIGAACRLLPRTLIFAKWGYPLVSIRYRFCLDHRKKQMIIHSDTEVEKMHSKRTEKEKPWKSFADNQDKYVCRVSLIGLPNSGKSSLFNCLIGERLAIVDNYAGMTRDRREYSIMQGLVKVIDTPGVQVSAFGKFRQHSIKHDIFKQTVTAIHQSNIIIIVLDSTKPVTGDEIEMVKYLKKFNKDQKIILACTKSEKLFDETMIFDQISKFGIQKVFFCSGETGEGVFEILDYIKEQVPQQAQDNLKQRKIQRRKKFEDIVKKMKSQMKELEEKGLNIKQWEQDFRKINPSPELNEDLDYEQFENFIIRPDQAFTSSRGTQLKNLKANNTIKICFIGRPNVGKSSLINEILGEQRMVVSETAHTTRDSIINKIIYKQRKVQLIDTAGLNNHDIERTPEEYLKKAQISTMLHVKQSHVVVYVMDAYAAFRIQDFKLIRSVIEEGRPIIIAVNKWEVVKQEYKYKAKNYLFKQIDENLGHMVHGHPIVFVSAKLNDGIDTLVDNVILAYDKWNSRISTGILNNWLDKFKKLDNLPKDGQNTLKINFVMQARVRPPHFIFFVNNKKLFKPNYMRFLTENVAKQFKMDGIPLRLSLRSTNNKENETDRKKPNSPKKMSEMKTKMDELRKKYNNFGL